MDELLKLVELVRRELAADDARLELGGREPTDPRAIFAALGPGHSGWRMVALFETEPSDAGAKRERLRSLLAPFADAASRAAPALAAPLESVRQADLDDALDALAERAAARAAVVIDERSPVLWGTSGSRADDWDLDAMTRLAELAREVRQAGFDPARWIADGAPSEAALTTAGIEEGSAQRWTRRSARAAAMAPDWGRVEWHEAIQIALAVGAARAACRGGRVPERLADHEDDWGVFAKGFARIYLLALVYDGAYSELHAEGPVVRALPHIEGLVLHLPPVEPPPRGAKVIALPTNRK